MNEKQKLENLLSSKDPSLVQQGLVLNETLELVSEQEVLELAFAHITDVYNYSWIQQQIENICESLSNIDYYNNYVSQSGYFIFKGPRRHWEDGQHYGGGSYSIKLTQQGPSRFTLSFSDSTDPEDSNLTRKGWKDMFGDVSGNVSFRATDYFKFLNRVEKIIKRKQEDLEEAWNDQVPSEYYEY